MKGMTCAILAVVIVAIIGIVRACDALSDYCKEREKRQVEAEFISEIKGTPLGDLTDAKLNRCSDIQSDLQILCLAERQKRVEEQLDNIIEEADSLFESGLVREYVEAFPQSEYRNHSYIANRIIPDRPLRLSKNESKIYCRKKAVSKIRCNGLISFRRFIM